MKTAVKVISIITLIIFILGILSAIGIGGFAAIMGIVANNAYNSDMTGYDALGGLFTMLGTGILWIAGLVYAFCIAVYDVVAHIPALIAHIVWKKTENKIAYWILIGVYAALLIFATILITALA